jgi:hypothetical protein
MLTDRQLWVGIALPGLVSMALMLIVVWRRWALVLPMVLGIAIMIGYWLLRRPELPPQDGCDWLFWMQVPLMVGGTLFQSLGARWAAMGAIAGAVTYVVLRPIMPAIGSAGIWNSLAVTGLWGTAGAITLPWAARRIDAMWIAAALAGIVGASAVVVLSSNFLTYGIIGMGAAMAILPIAVGLRRMAHRNGNDGPGIIRGLSVSIMGLLAGLLAGGRYYPHTGVSPFQFHVLGAAPLLIPLARCLPGKRDWVRCVAAVVLPSAIVWCIAIPAALAARHAAETTDSQVPPGL